jgi:hypothetical protein
MKKIIFFFFCAVIWTLPACKKNAAKEQEIESKSQNLEVGKVLVRKVFTNDELVENTVSKNVGPEGSALSMSSACTGDVYTLSYELTSCSVNQALNFYVRVGSQLSPQAVKLKVKQRVTGTTYREIMLTAPASVTQVASQEWEYKFVLVLSGFNICTDPTTDISLTSYARVRCESDEHGISFTDISTTQQFNLVQYNCRSYYDMYVDKSGNDVTFKLVLLSCGYYGICPIYPSAISYKYRLKNSGNPWSYLGTFSSPYTNTITLPSGTYEAYAYTSCTGEGQTAGAIYEFIVP